MMQNDEQKDIREDSAMDYIKAAVPFLQWATAVGVAAWFANGVIQSLDTWGGE